MRIDFEDDDLRRLYEDRDFAHPRIGPEITKAFRKAVNRLVAAESEVDLRKYKALRYKKLRGDLAGRRSVRLNDQWRLILRIETDEGGRLLLIIEIDDYH